MDSLKTGEFEYDRFGKIKYNKHYHFNHRKPFSEDDLMYLCKFWETVSAKELSLALGRTEKTLASKVWIFKKDGRYAEYIKKYDKAME